jgi:hypothetical protein
MYIKTTERREKNENNKTECPAQSVRFAAQEVSSGGGDGSSGGEQHQLERGAPRTPARAADLRHPP